MYTETTTYMARGKRQKVACSMQNFPGFACSVQYVFVYIWPLVWLCYLPTQLLRGQGDEQGGARQLRVCRICRLLVCFCASINQLINIVRNFARAS